MHYRRWIILAALTPGLATMARYISRAAAVTMVLCLYGLAGHVFGYFADARRADVVRAACLLYQATQTATGLLVGDGPRRHRRRIGIGSRRRRGDRRSQRREWSVGDEVARASPWH